MSYASSAIKRLSNEYRHLQRPENRVREYHVAPLEENIFEWHFTLRGPGGDDGTLPYKDGVYHGALLFTRAYPLEPPDILFFTRSGRFAVQEKICSTISSYHKELWQPTYDIALTLTALRHFMAQEDEFGVGAFPKNMVPLETKQAWAKDTWSHRCDVCGRATKEVWETEMKMHPEISPDKEAQVPKLPLSTTTTTTTTGPAAAADGSTTPPPLPSTTDAGAPDVPTSAAAGAAPSPTTPRPTTEAAAAALPQRSPATTPATRASPTPPPTAVAEAEAEAEAAGAPQPGGCRRTSSPSLTSPPASPAATEAAPVEVRPDAAPSGDDTAQSSDRPATDNNDRRESVTASGAVAAAAADDDEQSGFTSVLPARVVREHARTAAPPSPPPPPTPTPPTATAAAVPDGRDTPVGIPDVRFEPIVRDAMRREAELADDAAATPAAPAAPPTPQPTERVLFGLHFLRVSMSLRLLDQIIITSLVVVVLILLRRGLCAVLLG
ncbi:Ubiquitin-conjugating enzyme [Novymonas esmeraldas]|uniref:Ubiquitin-conjugating enzyme n=1 Tax=Novymonas esmeraldas TaxID=1808958 RepID=A0AAW0F1D2_9TRYP